MSVLITPKFRVSFPSVFEKKLNELSGKEEFSVHCIFSPDADLSELEAAITKCIVEKWGADKAKWPKKLKNPLRKSEEKEGNDGKMPAGYEKNGHFMNLKTQTAPKVVNQLVKPITDPNEFYPGCYAKAVVTPYAYDMKGNCGVAFGLGNIQKVEEGEKFGKSAGNPEDVFKPIANFKSDALKDLM